MNPPQYQYKKEGLAPARTSGFFYGYVITAAAFGVWLIGFGTWTPTFGVFLKPLQDNFGWSRADATLGYALSMVIQGALGVIVGWLTDRIGPRILVAVFGSFLGISYLLLSQVNALWQFQLLYAVMAAIGVSTLTAPAMASVARWFTRKRGLMTGIAQTGASIGGLIFAPFAGWLILNYDWRSAYVVIGIITLVIIIVSGLFLRRDPREMGLLPDGVRGTLPQAQKQNPTVQAAGFSFRKVLATRQFWMLVGIYCAFGFCRSTFVVHIAPHVQDLGFSLVDGANVVAVTNGASLIGRVAMGRVADIIGSRKAFALAYAATAVVLIWGLITRDLWGLYLFGLVYGYGWGGQAVLRFAVIAEAFGLASLGLIMGVLVLAESAVAALGTYFAGYLFDIAGNYDPAFWMGIAISIMGMVLTWLLKPVVREGVA